MPAIHGDRAAAAKLKVMDGKTFDDIAAFPASNFINFNFIL